MGSWGRARSPEHKYLLRLAALPSTAHRSRASGLRGDARGKSLGARWCAPRGRNAMPRLGPAGGPAGSTYRFHGCSVCRRTLSDTHEACSTGVPRASPNKNLVVVWLVAVPITTTGASGCSRKTAASEAWSGGRRGDGEVRVSVR